MPRHRIQNRIHITERGLSSKPLLAAVLSDPIVGGLAKGFDSVSARGIGLVEAEGGANLNDNLLGVEFVVIFDISHGGKGEEGSKGRQGNY